MRTRDRDIARDFGFLERVEALEKSLLAIPGVLPDTSEPGICFDLTSWQSGIRYVIIIPGYGISVDQGDYYDERKRIIQAILATANQFGLARTEDRLEDYGAHFYIVFRCDDTWPKVAD